ncbi:MAG: hypothetical protein L6Q29_00360 [Candidatus Pacebacteria bacterium]|nr:hypothetical protein [Candidatus Paceibacterota bacterium]
MKYPWVAIAVAVMWFGSTYLVLKADPGLLNTSLVLMVAIVGTIGVAYIGFKAPKIK